MDSRELYPSDEQRRRIMDFIMAAGETLLENGAEVFRVEQTMEIMARSFHLREFHVYVLTNGIFASAGTAEIAEVRNVPVRTTHLGRVAAVNALSREIAAGGVTLDEAEHRLADARRIPFPKGKRSSSAARYARRWRQRRRVSSSAAICCSVKIGGFPTASARSRRQRSLHWSAFWGAICWTLRPATPSSAP